MTKTNTKADNKLEPKEQKLRDLDAKSSASAIKGGRRKGGDPEEGGE